jgi:hypothetical protein
MPMNLKNMSQDIFVGTLRDLTSEIIASVIVLIIFPAIAQFLGQNLWITVAVFFAVLVATILLLSLLKARGELKDLQSFLAGENFKPISLDLEGFRSKYPEAKEKKYVPYRNLTAEGFLNYRRELPRGHIRLVVPFDIVVDPEDNGDRGVVGILLEPTSENEEQSFTNRARVEKVKSVFILLTANNGLTTWKGCKIGEILLHFEDDSSPQSLSLHLGHEIRDWWPWNKRQVGREPGPIDHCTSPAVTEVWHSSDRQVVLDMLRIDIDGKPKSLESITFKARLESVDWNKHLPDLPGPQILGITCWIAP